MGGPGPLGLSTNRPVVDRATNAVGPSQGAAPAGAQDTQQAFDSAFAALQAEIANAGFMATIDAAARARYDTLARAFRDEIYAAVRAGTMSWKEAADHARNLRDEIMQMIRGRSTPVGRAVAEKLKPQSPTLNQLIAKKTLELFGKDADFTRLSEAQRNRVYAAIVESAGKSNPRITARMRIISRAGKGLLVFSLGMSVYAVATAEDKVGAAKREGAVTGAGIAGGIAGGALAGLACGPGAPVCVTVGAFVGGALAAFGVDFLW